MLDIYIFTILIQFTNFLCAIQNFVTFVGKSVLAETFLLQFLLLVTSWTNVAQMTMKKFINGYKVVLKAIRFFPTYRSIIFRSRKGGKMFDVIKMIFRKKMCSKYMALFN